MFNVSSWCHMSVSHMLPEWHHERTWWPVSSAKQSCEWQETHSTEQSSISWVEVYVCNSERTGNNQWQVLSDHAELIANSMAGNLGTQLFCFSFTQLWIIWVTMQLACSVDLSLWGWYTKDIWRSVPMSLCRCSQKMLVNKTSLSLIICLGKSCSLYTFLNMSLAISLAW